MQAESSVRRLPSRRSGPLCAVWSLTFQPQNWARWSPHCWLKTEYPKRSTDPLASKIVVLTTQMANNLGPRSVPESNKRGNGRLSNQKEALKAPQKNAAALAPFRGVCQDFFSRGLYWRSWSHFGELINYDSSNNSSGFYIFH